MTDSLCRTFAPPLSIQIPEAESAAPAQRPDWVAAQALTAQSRSMPLIRRLALYATAAIVAIVGAIGLTIWSENRRPTPPDPSPDALYGRLVAGGFTPQWKCENDEQFKQAVQDRLGQPLLLASAVPGVEVLGWAYSNNSYDGAPLTDQVMILLARADSREVVVFVDQAKNDRERLTVRHRCGLQLFRREVGDLVAYELTPLSEPRVVQNFFVPDR